MTRHGPTDARQLVALLQAWGWVISKEAGGHIYFTHPDVHGYTLNFRSPNRAKAWRGATAFTKRAAIAQGIPLSEFTKGPP